MPILWEGICTATREGQTRTSPYGRKGKLHLHSIQINCAEQCLTAHFTNFPKALRMRAVWEMLQSFILLNNTYANAHRCPAIRVPNMPEKVLTHISSSFYISNDKNTSRKVRRLRMNLDGISTGLWWKKFTTDGILGQHLHVNHRIIR